MIINFTDFHLHILSHWKVLNGSFRRGAVISYNSNAFFWIPPEVPMRLFEKKPLFSKKWPWWCASSVSFFHCRFACKQTMHCVYYSVLFLSIGVHVFKLFKDLLRYPEAFAKPFTVNFLENVLQL